MISVTPLCMLITRSPMARKLAWGPSKLTQSGPLGPTNFEATVCSINEVRKSVPSEGHQTYDIKGPNVAWQFLLI